MPRSEQHERRRADVLIAGAGPVGLALATDLGMRGVDCLVVEQQPSHSPLPKMNHVNTRSMELCRRWGLAEAVRGAGWPDDHPMDVAYLTSFAGYEITRLPFPSHRQRPARDDTPEPSQRCPQIWFDPLLEAGLARFPNVEVQRARELVSLESSPTGVRARIRDVDSTDLHEIEARYLVGADGAGSRVRELVGIEREHWGPAPQQVAISLRARDFFGFHDKRRAAFYFVLDELGARSIVTPTDGERLWRFNWNLRPDESLDAFDPDAAIRRVAGCDFDYEIVTAMPWQIRFTLAERYREGRVFLAGDAARTLSPTGGLGMNTGLADAADLGWKLAGALAGWGGETLLDSYDAERRATGRAINEESLRNLVRVASIPRIAGIDEPGPDGEARRAEARRVIEQGDFRLEWQNEGAVLGARYADSPVIEAGDALSPVYDANHYTPSSQPGCRAPHAWLPDGRSTLDWFGDGFTLLCLGPSAPDSRALEAAALEVGLPLESHCIEDAEIAALYEAPFVLVRPDGVVAWRGHSTPASPAALIDRVRGAR